MYNLQINPIFLFNSLNNIDSLIYKSPDDASRMLMSLSEILNYIIFETKTEFVPLQQEIDNLTYYINLQKLRYKNSDYVNVTFPSEVSNIQIAPLLFIPFVENAFKHSLEIGSMPVIDISLKKEDGALRFSCFNFFDSEVSSMLQSQGGSGLENIKKRLDLQYFEKHHLQIIKNNNTFSVDLLLQL